MNRKLKSCTKILLVGTLLFSLSLPIAKDISAQDMLLSPKEIVEKNGSWQKDNNGWWYRFNDGTYAKGVFVKIKLKTYYFNEKGYMVTGWYFNNSEQKWYYFYPGNGAAALGWEEINGKWYYFQSQSPNLYQMTTGIKNVTGKWYYFDQINGDMKTGWQKIGEFWHYYDPVDGSGKQGWLKYNNKWYYFWTNYGRMSVGWWDIDGKTYYLDGRTGEMVTGWKKDNNKKWHYLDPNDGGAAAKNKTLFINGKYYTFDEKGILVKN
ncbi:hypothetical protein [Gemella cuniculi]|uniref:hypothetical protein n=1 Tax=Gemella cuniculi TaxID=150240 RepID=UPI00041F8F37|nr:hypothetical protein [Gemella cuniculi]